MFMEALAYLSTLTAELERGRDNKPNASTLETDRLLTIINFQSVPLPKKEVCYILKEYLHFDIDVVQQSFSTHPQPLSPSPQAHTQRGEARR